jgi:hypothetical protein
MYVSASLVDDPRSLIDHKLYWDTVASCAEGTTCARSLTAPCSPSSSGR